MGILILILAFLFIGIVIGLMIGYSRAMQRLARKAGRFKRAETAMLLIALGGGAFVAGLAAAAHTWHFTQIAQRASGTVIQMLSHSGKDSEGDTYAPTFQFRDAAGDQHTVSSSLYSSPPEFHVGDSVKVLYRSDSPETARIDTYWQVWGLPTLLGIMSSIMIPAGLVMRNWPKIQNWFGVTKAQAQLT